MERSERTSGSPAPIMVESWRANRATETGLTDVRMRWTSSA